MPGSPRKIQKVCRSGQTNGPEEPWAGRNHSSQPRCRGCCLNQATDHKAYDHRQTRACTRLRRLSQYVENVRTRCSSKHQTGSSKRKQYGNIHPDKTLKKRPEGSEVSNRPVCQALRQRLTPPKRERFQTYASTARRPPFLADARKAAPCDGCVPDEAS